MEGLDGSAYSTFLQLTLIGDTVKTLCALEGVDALESFAEFDVGSGYEAFVFPSQSVSFSLSFVIANCDEWDVSTYFSCFCKYNCLVVSVCIGSQWCWFQIVGINPERQYKTVDAFLQFACQCHSSSIKSVRNVESVFVRQRYRCCLSIFYNIDVVIVSVISINKGVGGLEELVYVDVICISSCNVNRGKGIGAFIVEILVVVVSNISPIDGIFASEIQPGSSQIYISADIIYFWEHFSVYHWLILKHNIIDVYNLFAFCIIIGKYCYSFRIIEEFIIRESKI